MDEIQPFGEYETVAKSVSKSWKRAGAVAWALILANGLG